MSGFAIQHLAGALNGDTFTRVCPRNDWMGVNIVNDSAEVIYVRTTLDDELTEYPIPANGGQLMVQAQFTPGNTAYRFVANTPAFYLKTAGGDGTGVRCFWA